MHYSEFNRIKKLQVTDSFNKICSILINRSIDCSSKNNLRYD